MATPPAIDHIIILLPYKDIVNPPEWLTQHFTISPGGRHGDNKTENKLIILKDGSYIELIAFIDDDPERRTGHWWDKEFGIVDFALTTQNEHFDPAVNERLKSLGTDITYRDPQRGGRTQPNGVQMEWEVTFPTNTPRGSVPFWCHDVTERDRRVPVSETSTTHPSGVTGVGAIIIRPPPAKRTEIEQVTAAIVGIEAKSKHILATALPSVGAKPYLLIDDTEGPEIELHLQVSTEGNAISISENIGNGQIRIELIKSI